MMNNHSTIIGITAVKKSEHKHCYKYGAKELQGTIRGTVTSKDKGAHNL